MKKSLKKVEEFKYECSQQTKNKAKEIIDYFIHYFNNRVKKNGKLYNEYVQEVCIMLEND